MLHMFSSFLVVQINPFRPSPIQSATDIQSSRFDVKIFSRSALAGGAQTNTAPVPEPALDDNFHVSCSKRDHSFGGKTGGKETIGETQT